MKYLKVGRNRLNWAGGNTLFADNTAGSSEVQQKRFWIESEGLGGTDTRA